jgi:hypothetical protein
MVPDINYNATGSPTISSIRAGNFIARYGNSVVCVSSFEPGFRDTYNVHVDIFKELSQIIDVHSSRPWICVTEPQAGYTNGGIKQFQDHVIKNIFVQGTTVDTITTMSHWRSTSARF